MPGGNKFVCICGFKGNSGHAGRCTWYKESVQTAVANMKLYIAEFYLTCYSITDCCAYIIEREGIKIKPSAVRAKVTSYLDSLGIRETLSGKTLNYFRQEKTKRTMSEKYGVINAGQLPGNGFKKQNLIPYAKLPVSVDYVLYRKKVEYLTDKQVGKLRKLNKIPTTCYYSDIVFNDVTLTEVNPNDPLKRTVDHKISVTEAFLRGWSPEKVSSVNNLVFCLRIINTIKGHLNEKDFKRMLLPLLLEKLKNENKNNQYIN